MGSLYIEAPGCVPVLLDNLHGMSCSGTCWPLGGSWFQCTYGGFIFLAISMCFALLLAIDLLFKKKIYVYLIFALAILLSMVIFAVLYTKINKPYCFLLFAIFPLAIGVISFVNNYLIIKER